MPGIGFTMASCSAYMIMNGVMIPGVSAGSNQVGASEMWTPQVICPSGAARDGVGVSHVTAERSVASAARTHRFSNGADRLMVTSSSRVASFGTSAQGKGTGSREWRDYRACATVRATRRCFMTRRTLLLALLAVIATAGAAVAEVCLSPWVKRLAGPEKFLYISAVDADGRDNDFLAVVDVSLPSPTYGRVVNTLSLGSAGNEPHHMGWSDDRTKIWVGALLSKKLFIVDVAADPSRPTIVKPIEDISAVTGLHGPHTYYALPGRMLLTFLSSADGNPPGGMAEFTNDGELVRVIKNPADSPYAYDVAVKPDVNRMITSSFTPLRNYRKPLPQWDMKDGGNTLLVWDFKERKVIQTLTTDPVPLEVRWSVRPGKAHGWTNSALGDSIWFFAQGKDGKFATKKVADLGKGCLPADLRQSPDDRYLYVSCFMKSEIQAWDVSTPDRPRLHDTVVAGVSPNMMHVTGDGKRMYVTNSLLSTMDYSEKFWVRLVHIGPDGRLKVDPFFDVDFTKFPSGAARAHDMLLN